MSEEEEEKKSPFVVRDRRRFDASGNPRGDEKGSDAPPAAAKAKPAPSPRASAAPRPAAPHPAADLDEMPEEEGEGHPVGFAEFILSIATNAVIHLGGDTKDGRLPGRVNLPLAAQHIDIIAMLAEKTRGNLDRDEQALLESLLYDLRMKYLAIAKSQGL